MIEDFTKRIKGINNPKAKINYAIANNIKIDRAKGLFLKDIAKKYNISISQVSAICNNKFWNLDNPELLEDGEYE